MLIGYYNYDQQADEFAKLSPANRVKRALEEGSKIHPQYNAEFESGISVAWHKTPTASADGQTGTTSNGKTSTRY